ncbi:MAG: hypothetical protein ISS72_05290 [Candidatus Brocadiae bacterium]|nr:hypothetical protein [Candidatus Brocadiia bacterium]
MTANMRDVHWQRVSRLVRPSVVLLVGVLLGTSSFAAGAARARVGAKPKLQQKSIPVPKVFVTPPKPNTMVLVDVARNRKIPFVQWLRLFGNATEDETTYPGKTPAYDGTWGNGSADAATGGLIVHAMDQGHAGQAKEAAVYWDFTHEGSAPLDIDYVVKFSPVTARPESDCGGPMAGGGFSKVILSLVVQDQTGGGEVSHIVYRVSSGNAGGIGTGTKATTEPRLPVHMLPGHKYRFAAQLEASACGYADPGPKGNQMRGSAEASGAVTVVAMGLAPTHGPKVEVKVLDVYPEVYDTWDRFETKLLRYRRMQYYPAVARVHLYCGGQYAAAESYVRIYLSKGEGKLMFLKPEMVAAAGWHQQRINDKEIRLTPPPPVAGGLGGFTFEPLVRVDMEASPHRKRRHYPVDYVLGPVLRVWESLDMRTPSKPQLVAPTNRLMSLYDATQWYVVMPADQAVAVCRTSQVKFAKPMPVLYATPAADSRAPAPSVPGWQVKTVPWSQVASPTLNTYNKPVVALNLDALSDLYLLDPNMRTGRGGKALTLSAGTRAAGRGEPVVVKPTTNKPTVVQPARKDVALYVKRLGNGYTLADPNQRQKLLNDINNLTGNWMKSLRVNAQDRPQLMLYIDENNQVITGKTLLEGIKEKGALAAMVDGYSQLKSIEDATLKLLLMWPHLDLYSEPAEISMSGVAQNGPRFRSRDGDAEDYRTIFDFVPRPAPVIITLTPYME